MQPSEFEDFIAGLNTLSPEHRQIVTNGIKERFREHQRSLSNQEAHGDYELPKTAKKFTADEMTMLPPKHEAHKNPNLMVERIDYIRMGLPDRVLSEWIYGN